MEVFCRMTGQLFFHEIMKYVVIVYSALGILYGGISLKSFSYIFCLLLFIPSIVVVSQNIPEGINLRKMIAFNLSGPVALVICAIYCLKRKLALKSFDKGIKLAICSVLMMTIYVIQYTPDNLELNSTASNFDLSGGFGPNQVATIFGLGMFFTFLRFILVKNLFYNAIDLFLFGLMSYRGWLTFSRGGIITGFAMIGVTLLFLYINKNKGLVNFAALSGKFVLIVSCLAIAFTYTSIRTGGLIENRYSGKDALGREKEDISSGRSDLNELEIQAFLENPIFGLGAGNSKYYRHDLTGIWASSHNEITRMFSEHGAVGLLILAVMFVAPLFHRASDKSNIYFYAFLGFWFATINHSAMRIAAPSFFYGLSLVSLRYKFSVETSNDEDDNKKLHHASSINLLNQTTA
jgi:hypothetical protein